MREHREDRENLRCQSLYLDTAALDLILTSSQSQSLVGGCPSPPSISENNILSSCLKTLNDAVLMHLEKDQFSTLPHS